VRGALGEMVSAALVRVLGANLAANPGAN
jgi:hypothetical protein